MNGLEYLFYAQFYLKKHKFCSLNAKKFYGDIFKVVTNNIPFDNFKIPRTEKCIKEHTEYISDFDIEKNKEASKIYNDLINFLEANKFKMDTNRKIEIFKIWFYWVSGSIYYYWEYAKENKQELLREIDIEMYSLKRLHETARSILYEIQNLTCCYTYKETNFKDSGISIYDDMCCQPDLLTRLICSQYFSNAKILFENGFKSDTDYLYAHEELKTVLHWALYANNIQIFKFLVKNGYTIKDNDIFYDAKYEKNFGFSVLLYVLKNKSKFENFDYFFDNLEFSDFDFMNKENIYKHLNEQELIEMFEFMFEIGFNLNANSLVVSRYSFRMVIQEDLNDFMCSQLFACIYQNNIKPNLINYLVNAYIERYGIDAARNEIVKLIAQSVLIFHEYLFFCRETDLETTSMITILNLLFQNLDRSAIIRLRKKLSKLFANFHFLNYFDNKLSPLIEKDSNYRDCYLFKRNYFKIFDIFIKYCVFEANDFYNISVHIDVGFTKLLYSEMDSLNSKHTFEFKVLFALYFLENANVNSDFILEWGKCEMPTFYLLSSSSKLLIEKMVCLMCEKFDKTPKSLLQLCRQKIRDSVEIVTDESIDTLGLPKKLNLYLKNTILIDEKDFYSFYDYLFKSANELLE